MTLVSGIKKHPDKLLILLAGIIVLWVRLNINGNKDYSKGLIESDARGYYAYLPAVFIYHDLNLGFFDSIEKVRYFNPNLYYEFRAIHNGNTINKYYAGTALCLSPFFLTGHWVTRFTDLPHDGYSMYYVKFTAIASVFYLVLSLFLLNGVFKLLNINTKIRIIVLMAMIFGTNLFYYNIAETCLSHVYSLAFFSLFIYYGIKFFQDPSSGKLLWMAFALGMITLIRPVNLLILASLPFLAGDMNSLKNGCKWIIKNMLPVLLSACVFLAIISIQLLIYKIQTGYWFLYSYKGEGFNFNDPHIIPILFSYKKGLFLYTPVYLVSLFGLYFVYKQQRFRFWSWIFFFLSVVYVLSSWHNWYYGGSFSGRVFIEFLPYFMIPLAMALQYSVNPLIKKALTGTLLLLVIVCQLQTYQYRRGQIHWSDQTKEKYWHNFLGIQKLKKMF